MKLSIRNITLLYSSIDYLTELNTLHDLIHTPIYSNLHIHV